MPIKLTKASQ